MWAAWFHVHRYISHVHMSVQRMEDQRLDSHVAALPSFCSRMDSLIEEPCAWHLERALPKCYIRALHMLPIMSQTLHGICMAYYRTHISDNQHDRNGFGRGNYCSLHGLRPGEMAPLSNISIKLSLIVRGSSLAS
ncbi:hypothetical protein VNO77_19743 [Canavalia gladiata]|uniref:Uncharacterized protein n=1 Tax=Canavalia gladiata TaxID=3824 RepID=A0AAN9LN36_CANGL